MTKPTEPLYPSHPAHVIHHEHCGHILRRVLKPVPGDNPPTGCMCDYPPEMKWRTKRAEFNGITAEIDELTYEAKIVQLDCSYCYGVRMGLINLEGESLEENGKKSKKRAASKSPPKSKKAGRKPRSKQRKVASSGCDSSMTSLDTEASFASDTTSASSEKRRSGRGNHELVLENPDFSFDPIEYFEEGSLEDRVWKALRSRTVRR